MGTRCADHVTPLYPQKLALTSPTDGGRSVSIVRSRTKATEKREEKMYVCMYVRNNVRSLIHKSSGFLESGGHCSSVSTGRTHMTVA